MSTNVGNTHVDIGSELNHASLKKFEAGLKAELERIERQNELEIKAKLKNLAQERAKAKAAFAPIEQKVKVAVERLDILRRIRTQSARMERQAHQSQMRQISERMDAIQRIQRIKERHLQDEEHKRLQIHRAEALAHRENLRRMQAERQAQLDAINLEKRRLDLFKARRDTFAKPVKQKVQQELDRSEMRFVSGLDKHQVELELKNVALYKARVAAATKPVDQRVNLEVDHGAFKRFTRALTQMRYKTRLLSRTLSGLRPIFLALVATLIFFGQALFHIIGSLGRAATAAIALPVALGALTQGLLVTALASHKFGIALGQYIKDLSDAGPAAQKYAEFLKKEVLPQIDRFENRLRSILSPYYKTAIRTLMKHFDGFGQVMERTAHSVGDFVERLANWATTVRSLREFSKIGIGNLVIFKNLGRAAINLLDVIRTLWAAAIPLTIRFSKWLRSATRRLRELTREAADDGRLARFFHRAGDAAAQWGRILGNVAVAIFNTFKAASGETDKFVNDLEQVTERWRKWTESIEGQEKMRQFFKTLREINWAGMAKGFLALAGLMAAIKAAHTTIALLTVMFSISGIAALGFVAIAASLAGMIIVSEPLRKSFLGLWTVLRDHVGPIFREIFEFWKNQLLPIGARVAQEMLPHIERAIKIVTDAWNRNKAELFAVWKMMNQFIIPVVGTLLVAAIYILAGALVVVIEILGFFARVMRTIVGVVKTVASWLRERLAPVFRWLWENVVRPVVNRVARAFHRVRAVVVSTIRIVVEWLRARLAPVFRWLLNNVVRPTWNRVLAAFRVARAVITTVVRVIGAVIRWLWRNIFRPIFNAIASVVRWAWKHVIRPVFNAISSVIRNVLAPIFRVLWKVVKVVWKGISTAIKIAWGIIKFIFQAYWAFVKFGLMVVLGALWKVVKAVWNNIRKRISAVWKFLLKYVFKPLGRILAAVGRWFMRLWKKYIAPVWNAVKRITIAMWRFIKNKVFDPLIRVVKKVLPRAFRIAKDAIAKIWEGLKNAVRKPVLFVVETIYQNGIRKMWQKVRSKVPGLPELPNAAGAIRSLKDTGKRRDIGPSGKAKAKFAAAGGKMRGPGTGTSDSIPAMVSNGEWVIRASAARKYGDSFMRALNEGRIAQFAQGGSISELIAFARKSGAPVNVTSTYRPGDPGHHGSSRAVDFGGFNQDRLARHFMSVGKGLLELIHTTNSAFYGVKNGKAVGRGFYGAQVGLHRNHLHAAANPGFSEGKGGILGAIKGFFGRALSKVFTTVYDPIANRLKSKADDFHPIAGGFARFALNGIRDAISKLLDSRQAAGGLVGADGSVMQQALKQAQSMGATKKVLLALFEAGFVESGFRNGPSVRFKDHDSAGFLQQRVSQGWGTLRQVENVPYATRSFVSRAMRIQGRYSSAGRLAQAVQRSAFPGRYDQMESRARAALRSLGVKGFDRGGQLQPGMTPAVNQTGQPEAVLTGRQWAAISSLAASAIDRPIQVNVGVDLDGEPVSHRARVEVERFGKELKRETTAKKRR